MNAREAQALFIIKALLESATSLLECCGHSEYVPLEKCIPCTSAILIKAKAQKFVDKMEARYKRDAEGYKPE